jgi:hypothetical protein
MLGQQKTANANYESVVELKTPLEQIFNYSEINEKIIQDFQKGIQNSGRNIPNEHGISKLLKTEFCKFEARCFHYARKFIENYDGGLWTFSPNGIYTFNTNEEERFTVVNFLNQTSAVCNSLEASIFITLLALDESMRHPNEVISGAMIYLREKIMALNSDQYKNENSHIDCMKILALVD